MKFGWSVQNSGGQATEAILTAIAEKVDGQGYDSIWVSDHVVVPSQMAPRYPYSSDGKFTADPSGHVVEPLAVLCYLAARTRRVMLGTSVLILPYRNPVLTAKVLASLDYLSGGRLILGIGVGWMEEEFQAMGSPPFAERGDVTDEYVRIFKECWTKDEPSFEGRFYRFAPLKFAPKPIQKPHPPIWIGGHTPVAMRRAARYGDGWQPIGLRPPAGLRPPELAAEIATLRRLTVEAGRPPESVEVSFRAPMRFSDDRVAGERTPFVGRASQIIDDIRQYAAVGVSHQVFDLLGLSPAERLATIDRFTRDVLPAFRERPAAPRPPKTTRRAATVRSGAGAVRGHAAAGAKSKTATRKSAGSTARAAKARRRK